MAHHAPDERRVHGLVTCCPCCCRSARGRSCLAQGAPWVAPRTDTIWDVEHGIRNGTALCIPFAITQTRTAASSMHPCESARNCTLLSVSKIRCRMGLWRNSSIFTAFGEDTCPQRFGGLAPKRSAPASAPRMREHREDPETADSARRVCVCLVRCFGFCVSVKRFVLAGCMWAVACGWARRAACVHRKISLL